MDRQFLALAATASILGHKHGIEVVLDPRANTASTDGKRITLPVVTTLGNEDHVALIEGLVDHEAMHVRHTDFSVLQNGTFSPLVASLGNLIEDVWGEREQAVIYPGCARSIRKSMEVMIKLGWYRGPGDDPVLPSMLLTNWLLHGLLARWYKLPELETMARDYHQKAAEVFGDDLSNQIWSKALEVDCVKSTEVGYQLAQSLSDMLMAAMPSKPKKPEQQALAGAITQAVNAESQDCATTDAGERISCALNSYGVMGPGAKAPPKATKSEALKPADFQYASQEERESHEQAVLQARAIEVRLGSKLESLLEAKLEVQTEHKRYGRKLDSRKLSGIALGRTKVYQHCDEEEGLNTSVKLLLDASGSMHYSFGGATSDTASNRITSAAAVAYAAAQVLERHSIPFSVDLFGSTVTEYKGFDQKWRRQREQLLTPNSGGTDTYGALIACMTQLLDRPESRKQVILVTDGEPNDAVAALALMNLMRGHGIMFAILFIGSSGNIFETALTSAGYTVCRASTPNDLGTSFFEALKHSF